MFKSYRVGSLAGIPIRLDITFLIILPVFAWVIGIQITELNFILNQSLNASIDTDAITAGNRPWILGFVAAVGLFLGVVLHELGHSLVSIRYGYPIQSITLWLLGGVAQLEVPPRNWRHELWIAIAGPTVSIALGVICYGIMLVLPISANALRFVFGYLAVMNVVLAVFNMLPGFPMDGGRVLRALLARRRPFVTATRQAGEVGKLFAIGMGLLGLLLFNLLLIALAFFIYIAATGEVRQVILESAFEGIHIRDVMTPSEDVKSVSSSTTIEELLKQMFHHRHMGYPVIENGDLLGVITFDDVRSIPPDQRETLPVREVMSTELTTVSPDRDAVDALQMMHQNGIGRLIVVDGRENFVGLVTRTDLVRAFTILQESGMTELTQLGPNAQVAPSQ